MRRDARRLGHLRPGHGRRTPHRRAGHAGSRLLQRLMAAARDGQGLCGLAGWAVARWAVAGWAVAGWAVAMEDAPAIGAGGGGGAVGIETQAPAPAVDDGLVVEGAQRHQVVQRGGATLGARNEVVD